MTDSYSLITSIATAFGLALPFGYVAEKFLRSPALVGYILAGLAVNIIPGLPPINGDVLQQLADIGIMLLMFGVGLHFSLKDLSMVKSVSIPGSVLQMALITTIGTLVSHFFWGWSIGGAVVLGLAISSASTVVVTKALEVRHLTADLNGQAAIGWLVMQDLISVVILVCLPPFADIVKGSGDVSLAAVALQLAKTLGGAAIFVVAMLVVGRKVMPWLLKLVAVTGSRELFTLAVLSCAIIIAYGASAIFNLSFALGAFFAGMVMRESSYSHRAAKDSLPLQDAFSVLFFVAIGMMLDFHIFLEHPFEVLAIVVVVLFFTTSISASLVLLLRWPLRTALLVGVCLGQIGEFSFILTSQGIDLGLVDKNMMSLVVAASIVLIMLNPGLFALEPRIEKYLTSRWKWAKSAEKANADVPYSQIPKNISSAFLDGHVVIIDYSKSNNELLRMLVATKRNTVMICDPNDPVEELKKRGFVVILGSATDPKVLEEASISTASLVVLPSFNMPRAYQIAQVIREQDKTVPLLCLVHSVEETTPFDLRDPNFEVLCENLMGALTLAAEAVERLLKPQDDQDVTEEQRQELRAFLKKEYESRVSTEAQKPGTPVPEFDTMPEADLQANLGQIVSKKSSAPKQDFDNEGKKFGFEMGKALSKLRFWRKNEGSN